MGWIDNFLSFDLKGRHHAKWRSFDSPEDPRTIIRAIETIAGPIPPTARFPP